MALSLSCNPNAVHLLEENELKNKFDIDSKKNPNAIHIIENHLVVVSWTELSENPNAIELLENNLDKVNWITIWKNPNIFYNPKHYKPTKSASANLAN